MPTVVCRDFFRDGDYPRADGSRVVATVRNRTQNGSRVFNARNFNHTLIGLPRHRDGCSPKERPPLNAGVSVSHPFPLDSRSVFESAERFQYEEPGCGDICAGFRIYMHVKGAFEFAWRVVDEDRADRVIVGANDGLGIIDFRIDDEGVIGFSFDDCGDSVSILGLRGGQEI